MSGKANNAGIYNFDNLNAQTLYIKGKRFEDYINELVFEDALEQDEITEIKLLLEYLDTTGLNSAWTVTNSNVNETLRSAITALQTKLANIDTTALTQSSVLNNDNRNSVLKTRLDTAASDLTALTTRVTTAEGDIDNVENKTKYIQVTDGDYNDANTINSFSIGYVPNSGTTLAKHKKAYFGLGALNQGILYEHIDQELDDLKIYNVFGPMTLWSQHNTFRAANTDIGFVNQNVGTYGETINIGSSMSRINIGSVENPKIGVGTPVPDSDFNNSTKITIGKRTTLKNTWTYLAGNFYTSEARWEDLPRTDKFSWTQLLALIPTTGVPLWVVSFALTSSIPNFEYSDTLVLKDGGSGQNKTGEMTTSNNLKTSGLVIFNRDLNIAQLTPIEGTFVARGTISKTTLDGSIRNSVFLDGGGNNKICLKHHNIAASDITEWATTEANDKCNVLEIGGNSGFLLHQGAANAGTDIKIINSKAGNIVLKVGTGGGIKANTKDSFTVLHDANYPGAAIGRLSPQAFATDETARTNSPIARLEIDCVANRKGIRLFGYDPASPLTLGPDETNLTNQLINTPAITATTATATSLVINGNYTGNTDARLYKNADNKLMWNGAEVGAGGVSSGGITYMINVGSNISNPSPTPTETIMTAAYSGNPQRTITQAVSANTAYYIAKYTTEVFDEVTNPVLTGLQQLNQYLVWNSQNQVGQLYGQLWFQATAIGFGVLYQRTYASPVTTTASQFINGTPIPTPKGLYNIKFQRVVFPNINVVVTSGTVVFRYRVEGYDFLNGWVTLTSMAGSAPQVTSTTNNLTITLDESKILNQTSSVGAKTAVRLVLYIASGTGTISQTSAGGADLAAYSLIGLGDNTPALFRTMLYDGTNAKITVPYSTTPTLIEYDLAIDAPYNVSAFASPTLSTDLYFIQPAGGFNNHAITLYFNEGSISHYHSTIAAQTTSLTLAQVLNSGATASQPINMNTNKISGITALEGSSNGNWNVKEITAGTNITVSPTNGNYTITNNAPVQEVAGGTGIQIAKNGTTATIINNAAVQNLAAGTGISIQVDTATRIATITNTTVGATQVGVAGTIRDEHQSLYEVGALPRKPDYWAKEWSVPDSIAQSHRDIYVSVDGKIIVRAGGLFTIRFSTDYGTTWNNSQGLSIATIWTSICGTSNGSKLFAFGTFQASNGAESLVLYTSLNQGASWTQITSSAFTTLFKVNRVRCSGDGTYLLASDNTAIDDGRILYSTNGGTTWARQAPGDLSVGRTEGVAMSRSGAIQFLTWISNAGDSSRVLRSIDYGFTWSEVSVHLSGGNWTRIETDATGRFVFATRYVNINTPTVETYRSDNYGITWFPTNINGVEDIWVSGTGQFVAGVSNPQGGVSYVVYSTDYGRSFTGVNMTAATGSGTTYRTINGSADGSILVLGSDNNTEGSPSFTGDGLLRIARSGVQNIYDMLQNSKSLWYITNLKSSTAVNTVSFPINTTYGDINFDTHNIDYEIEINWDRHTTASPSAHIRMGFNGIDSDTQAHSANTTWRFMLEQTAIIHAGNQGSIGYDQHFNNRFYCGYSAVQGTGETVRYRTLLTGQLGVQKRRQAQLSDLGNSFSADWSFDARTLTNRFTSDNYLLVNHTFSTTAPDRSRLFAQSNFDDGHHSISGTAIWELTDAGAWESGSGVDPLKNGIKNINISFINNSPATGINRSFDMSARFWRVRK